jgi:predicted RNA binding protein YcfA (HicA-like mRNA interferase family)
MNAKELIKKLKEDGWFEIGQEGSHKHFKHNIKKGKVTVPFHNGDIKLGTLKSILKQADLK